MRALCCLVVIANMGLTLLLLQDLGWTVAVEGAAKPVPAWSRWAPGLLVLLLAAAGLRAAARGQRHHQA
jgi:hypothetical protein